jgi:hypothetical protein
MRRHSGLRRSPHAIALFSLSPSACAYTSVLASERRRSASRTRTMSPLCVARAVVSSTAAYDSPFAALAVLTGDRTVP